VANAADRAVGAVAPAANRAVGVVAPAATRVVGAVPQAVDGTAGAANAAAGMIVGAVRPGGGGVEGNADTPDQPTRDRDTRAAPAASSPADPEAALTVSSEGGSIAAADGDAVGGGNDVRPSPGTGDPPPDGLCQDSPVCLGILFADGDGSAAGAGGFPITLPLTGLDALVGLLIAALLGLAGVVFLSPDVLGRRRTMQLSLASVSSLPWPRGRERRGG
jgi:hypothetical protein